jgi:hypothetical protein
VFNVSVGPLPEAAGELVATLPSASTAKVKPLFAPSAPSSSAYVKPGTTTRFVALPRYSTDVPKIDRK